MEGDVEGGGVGWREIEYECVHMCWLHFTFTPFSLSRPSMNCMLLLTFEACLLSLNLIFFGNVLTNTLTCMITNFFQSN